MKLEWDLRDFRHGEPRFAVVECRGWAPVAIVLIHANDLPSADHEAGTPSMGSLPPMQNKKPDAISHVGLSLNTPGSDLLSHRVSPKVPSTVAGLTSVFGMGTGVTLLL
jgi:hypothetical protein